MYNDEQILQLVEPIGLKLIGKDVYKMGDLSYKDKMDINSYYNKAPDLNPIYLDAIRHRNEVAVHAVKDTFPYNILRDKAPNQTEPEWKWQKENYQSCTLKTWGRAENKTKIIANKQNYSIEGWDKEQKKYFYSDYPTYHNLESYIFDVVRKKKINFPNQVLLVRPEVIPYKEVEGGFIIDQSEQIKYIVDVVNEFRTASFKEGKHLLVICDKQVNIESRRFYQFDFYDDMNIYKIVPTGYSDGKIIYDIQFILEHGWGYLPAQKLKGEIQESIDGNVLYYSIFSNAIPDLNDATRLNSNLSISENGAAFPTRIRVVDKCSYKDNNNNACMDGKVWSNSAYSNCPSCDGSGTDKGISVAGEIQVKMYSSHLAGQATQLPMTPPMTYVSPPVDIYTHLDSRIKQKMANAFAFMFESENADAGTATGKQLEKEEFYSSLIQFSNELFNLLHFSIEAIGFFMFNDSFVMPTIRRPVYFNFRTPADITKEVTDAKTNNMPDSYIKKLLEEYGSTRFNSDEEIEEDTELLIYTDRLWNKDDATIRLMINSSVTVLESIVHTSFTTLVEQCKNENEDFDELDIEKRKVLVFEKAQLIVDELTPVSGATGAAAVMAAVGEAV